MLPKFSIVHNGAAIAAAGAVGVTGRGGGGRFPGQLVLAQLLEQARTAAVAAGRRIGEKDTN